MTVVSAAPTTHVRCYAGVRSPERPTAFEWAGRWLAVAETLRQWRSPTALIFEVLADDGRRYRLNWLEADDRWVIAPVDAA